MDFFCAAYHRAFITADNNVVIGGHNNRSQCAMSISDSSGGYHFIKKSEYFGSDMRLLPGQQIKFAGGGAFSMFYVSNELSAELRKFVTKLHDRLVDSQLSDIHFETFG